jgi:hypothetical protein
MRRIAMLITGTVLLVLPATTGFAGVTGQATGAGHIGEGENRRTFAFTAVQRPDGTASGQAQLYARGFPARVHMEVTCVRIEGSVAYVSGVNTIADPAFFEGVWAVFAVEDNGEGAGAIDRVTQLHPAENQGPEACLTESPSDWMDVDDGNVRIR